MRRDGAALNNGMPSFRSLSLFLFDKYKAFQPRARTPEDHSAGMQMTSLLQKDIGWVHLLDAVYPSLAIDAFILIDSLNIKLKSDY